MARTKTQTEIDPKLCKEIAESCACFNFRKAARDVTKLYDSTLAPVGLTSSQFVILVAAELLGQATMSGFSAALGQDRSTLTRNLRPMVRKGLIQVKQGSDSGDRRQRKVSLKPAGRALLARALPYWERAQRTVEGVYGKSKWSDVLSSLSKTENLRAGR